MSVYIVYYEDGFNQKILHSFAEVIDINLAECYNRCRIDDRRLEMIKSINGIKKVEKFSN